jgi:Flp pilus assembly protein TadB
MRYLVAIPALALAASVGLLAYWMLGGIAGVLASRTRRILDRIMMPVREPERPSEEEVYGLPSNLTLPMILCAAGGLVLTMNMMTGPVRFAGAVAVIVPLLWRQRVLGMARQRARQELWEILEQVHLSLVFGGSLAATLMNIADAGGNGIVRGRMQAHRQTLLLQGPEEFLEVLSGELQINELRGLLRRVRAARRGGTSYEEAVRSAIADVRQEIWHRAEVDVEGAPIRLLLPMVFTLLPTALVLILYPPAEMLRSMLAGAGPGILP